MDYSIREAISADYLALNDIFAEVHALHLAALPQIFRQPEGPVLPEAYVAELIADPEAALLVAARGEWVAGLLIVKLHAAPDRPVLTPRHFAMIHDLAVRGECRRSGIGRALMERAHQWAREHGASEIELTVWEFNTPAIAFYEQLGYTTLSRKLRLPLIHT